MTAAATAEKATTATTIAATATTTTTTTTVTTTETVPTAACLFEVYKAKVVDIFPRIAKEVAGDVPLKVMDGRCW